MRSYAGATYSTRFDAQLLASLKRTGAAHGTTLFTMLFLGFQTVLGRLSNAADIVIAVPVAGQAVDDEPDLVGHCVDMLPFRVPLAWDAPLATHVETVAQRLLDGFDHPRCTYGTLVRALPVQRAAGRLPLTEFQFNLERLSDALDFGGPAAGVTPNAKAAVNFDVFVNVIESAAGLRIDCDYNTDLFEPATIARWMEHYRRILEGMCAAPTTTMAALPMLSAAQETFLLDTVNDSAAAYPRDKCLHELFAAQAARTPQAIACVDGAGTLTYAELDRQSTRLAQEILAATALPSSRIAIATDRSRSLLVALLGAMKSGRAYIPLDVDQPLERLRQIAVAAQIDGIVCQDAQIRSIAPGAFAVRIDQIDFTRQRHGPTLPRVSTDDSAYILFTSGSTGAPKGVEVGHRALTNVITCVARLCELGGKDVAIASSAVTFDVAATELYAPLIAGGRVVLADMEVTRSGFGLVALADTAGATLMQATPTLWRMLVEAGFSSHAGLKMISAGEALPRDLADRLLAGGGRLWNLYGPTEAAIYSSGGEILAGNDGVTIGRPLANTQLYVLDDRDGIAPPGVVGNLFIGGDGLAKGYFDRSDLTAEAFRTISLAGRAPQRLYRTGDLARLLPSGTFELRGRVDRQVKLRGFRIELEEIEYAVRQHPEVRDCAVLLRGDAGPDPAIVAYLVLSGGTPAGVAADLRRRLPNYMVPAHWVRLEALPLTSSGKVDRNALPPPRTETTDAVVTAASRPRTELEGRIAAIWADVIGRRDIGTQDPLFALGADSLQVFRIAARLSQEGIAIDARDLMKNPTVAALAATLEGRPETPSATPGKKGPSLADFRRGARRHTVTQ
jgi:amino acid adenylation domain-containing protein